MENVDKVIQGLELCKYEPDPGQTVKYLKSCVHCPYWNDGKIPECSVLYTDAIKIIREQQRIIEQYHRADIVIDAHGMIWKRRFK